ncbi:MAG: pyridoxal-phosphate dependent enzyme [Acidobacteria bacterium]|nr:pyridoxal-phosphate dependent enzyme [Acidobacteriota bacterium]
MSRYSAESELAVFAEFAEGGDAAYSNAVQRFRDQNIVLPRFSELRDPSTMPEQTLTALADVDKDAADPLNLFRVHWYNEYADGAALDAPGLLTVPDHIELPSALTGVDARIVLAFGNRFPMIRAHKVLAAYSTLVTRLVTGRFDPTVDRAIWPSTGNYARGGIAISKIMGCRGVAVLPEGMSAERFEWLEEWIDDPADVIRTVGTESNVKEIYDECNRLSASSENVILNQFSEFSNHLGHYSVTGPALERVYEHVSAHQPGRLAAFVAASGSAGTLGAGDYLKDHHDARIVAVEALEVPTMLYNGFGDHNIQGIGDKHIPLIHNVTNTDMAIAISDRSTDELDVLFNTEVGKRRLVEHGVDAEVVELLVHMGYSSICNMLASIVTARRWNLGADDIIVSVATDGSEMYNSERAKVLNRHFQDRFDEAQSDAVLERHLIDVDTTHVLEMGPVERDRVFNLGYFTWVEQQGVSIADFERRRDQQWWDSLRSHVDRWDEQIVEFNAATGVTHG